MNFFRNLKIHIYIFYNNMYLKILIFILLLHILVKVFKKLITINYCNSKTYNKTREMLNRLRF